MAAWLCLLLAATQAVAKQTPLSPVSTPRARVASSGEGNVAFGAPAPLDLAAVPGQVSFVEVELVDSVEGLAPLGSASLASADSPRFAEVRADADPSYLAGLGMGMGGGGLPFPADSLALDGADGPSDTGYVVTGGIYDNPLTTGDPLISALPQHPECTVKPQTVIEIQKYRKAAAGLVQSIRQELVSTEKRKAYIEQMTAYINDRIRDINKVKGELNTELRWISMSNDRIKELATREKMAKYADVLSCVQSKKVADKNKAGSVAKELKELGKKYGTLTKDLKKIRKGIADNQAGKKPSA